MQSDEKILKSLENIQTTISTLQSDMTMIKGIQQKQGNQIERLVDEAVHTRTALKTVATKQDVDNAKTELRKDISEVRAELKDDISEAKTELKTDISEVKTDVHMLDSKITKKLQSHGRRIQNIEDREDIENPDKN